MPNFHIQKTALGMVETVGLVASIEALDAMSKVSDVSFSCQEEIGGGYLTIMVRGEVGAVQESVDAGVSAAKKTGQVVSAYIIPGPTA
jgi:ethanolamine utilization protein EutM